ncbi:unnamed protein product [Paramecium pentaurelia]|uniref:Uncharacterized protein n=1 Tax=Paramecium pentaurelia TaxID=43138 RepID=A0A8S1W6X2_9CILI|nr:unnamed protein product [Paramecium pentaurelia]
MKFIIQLYYLLNKKYNNGLNLNLLQIDKRIKAYRHDSQETIKYNYISIRFKNLIIQSILQLIYEFNFCINYSLQQLHILLDFQEKALNRCAIQLEDGHNNADDMAEKFC